MHNLTSTSSQNFYFQTAQIYALQHTLSFVSAFSHFPLFLFSLPLTHANGCQLIVYPLNPMQIRSWRVFFIFRKSTTDISNCPSQISKPVEVFSPVTFYSLEKSSISTTICCFLTFSLVSSFLCWLVLYRENLIM